MVARQGDDILVVTDVEKVLYDDTVDRATSHSQAGLSTGLFEHGGILLDHRAGIVWYRDYIAKQVSRLVEITAPSGVHDCWESSIPARDTLASYSGGRGLGSRLVTHIRTLSSLEIWPVAFSQSVASQKGNDNANGTTMGKFSIFDLLRGCFTLPSFRSLLCYALLVKSLSSSKQT